MTLDNLNPERVEMVTATRAQAETLRDALKSARSVRFATGSNALSIRPTLPLYRRATPIGSSVWIRPWGFADACEAWKVAQSLPFPVYRRAVLERMGPESIALSAAVRAEREGAQS